LTLALALAACHELTLDPNHVVALEVLNSAPRVVAGDTLRMMARALNATGQPVSGAVITWASLDTATSPYFVIDPSGLITGIRIGADSIQARAADLRSGPITVNVVAAPSPSARAIVPRSSPERSEGERGQG
jgi:hypothetical protein